MRTSWLACLMCAGCGLHNAWSRSCLLKEMGRAHDDGGSDRACGLLHPGLRTPALSNTHWSLLACPLFRSLYGQAAARKLHLVGVWTEIVAQNPPRNSLGLPLLNSHWLEFCCLFLFGFFFPSLLCSFLLSSNDRAAAPRHKGIPLCS